MVVPFNPITLEAEVDRSLRVPGHPGLCSESQDSQGYSEQPCLEIHPSHSSPEKKKKNGQSLNGCLEKVCEWPHAEQPTILKRTTDQSTGRFHVTASGRAKTGVGEVWKQTGQSHVTVGTQNSTSVEKNTQAFSSPRVTQRFHPEGYKQGK